MEDNIELVSLNEIAVGACTFPSDCYNLYLYRILIVINSPVRLTSFLDVKLWYDSKENYRIRFC